MTVISFKRHRFTRQIEQLKLQLEELEIRR
jgi:hypothetical protein